MPIKVFLCAIVIAYCIRVRNYEYCESNYRASKKNAIIPFSQYIFKTADATSKSTSWLNRRIS